MQKDLLDILIENLGMTFMMVSGGVLLFVLMVALFFGGELINKVSEVIGDGMEN